MPAFMQKEQSLPLLYRGKHMHTLVIAHRGASYQAPENTLDAFWCAVQMGADGIELDVQLTKDGHMVVIHDSTVDRTSNGCGAVRDQTLEELRTLDFSMGKQDFSNTRIPTLDEVYSLVQDTDIRVNVELKDNTVENGEFAILPRALELEQRYGMTGRVFYSSFNHHVLRAMKQMQPAAETAALYAAGLIDVWDYVKKAQIDGIHPHFSALQEPNLVTNCHQNGIYIRPWTVDSEQEMHNMLEAGVDAIITNHPDIALRLRDVYENKPASAVCNPS